jgi:hypothetical protein
MATSCVRTADSADGNAHTYSITDNSGQSLTLSFSGSQQHCDNVAAARCLGGYEAALNAGKLIVDGIWDGLDTAVLPETTAAPHTIV